MSEQLTEFERETGTVRHTEPWARRLAKDTAEALGERWAVVVDYPEPDVFRTFTMTYVVNRLYCGEIGHAQVICGYDPNGNEISREAIWKMR